MRKQKEKLDNLLAFFSRKHGGTDPLLQIKPSVVHILLLKSPAQEKGPPPGPRPPASLLTRGQPVTAHPLHGAARPQTFPIAKRRTE